MDDDIVARRQAHPERFIAAVDNDHRNHTARQRMCRRAITIHDIRASDGDGSASSPGAVDSLRHSRISDAVERDRANRQKRYAWTRLAIPLEPIHALQGCVAACAINSFEMEGDVAAGLDAHSQYLVVAMDHRQNRNPIAAVICKRPRTVRPDRVGTPLIRESAEHAARAHRHLFNHMSQAIECRETE